MMRQYNNQRMQASLASALKSPPKVGTITSYLGEGMVMVQLSMGDPENPTTLLRGPYQLLASWVGANWGMICAPTTGTPCLVFFENGNQAPGSGFVQPVYMPGDGINCPPALGGEFWLVHETGSSIKLTNDGKVTITSNDDTNQSAKNLNITLLENYTLEAEEANINSLNISLGDLSNMGTLVSLMTSIAVAIYNGHTHPYSGGPNTQAPTQQMDGSVLTTNVKAN